MSIDLADPNVSAEVAKKRRLMELAKRRDGTGSRRGNSPAPGNHVVKKWVVLDLGNRPSRATYDPWSAGDDHRISFTGLGPAGAGSRDLALPHTQAVAGGGCDKPGGAQGAIGARRRQQAGRVHDLRGSHRRG